MGNELPPMQPRQQGAVVAAAGGASLLECGDWSPLLRRRLVAVAVRCGSEPARALALARAVNAPFRTHAYFSSTATSRLGKAVTSHRTPKFAP